MVEIIVIAQHTAEDNERTDNEKKHISTDQNDHLKRSNAHNHVGISNLIH